MKPSNDREAVSLILNGMVAVGHSIVEVADDTWNTDERQQTTDPNEATEMVMAVDEAYVFLNTPEGTSGYIYFVLGNDPEEVACDYTTNLSPDLDNIVDPWWGNA